MAEPQVVGAAATVAVNGSVAAADLPNWRGPSADASDLERGLPPGDRHARLYTTPHGESAGARHSPSSAQGQPWTTATCSFSLTVHCVEGALCASAGAPFVRVHLVDTETGLWRQRSATPASQHAVYNLDAAGIPYLRTTPTRTEPWQADLGKGKLVLPFSTLPCLVKKDRTGASSAPPSWNESFQIVETPGLGTILLFELLDAVEAKHVAGDDSNTPNSIRCVKLGWAFLNMDHATATTREGKPRHRRCRLQLYRYRAQRHRVSSGWLTETADEDRNAPDVFSEYKGNDERLREATGNMATFWSTAFACASRAMRPKRQEWPAALEVSFEFVTHKRDFAAVAAGLESADSSMQKSTHGVGEQSMGLSGAAGAELGAASSGGEESGVGELPDAIAPHNFRNEDEPCVFPDSLLWQIVAGKRGAYKLRLSPSGTLLAAAVAQRSGSSELKIFSLSTGRLHAVCASAHDAFVYDLCWHAFTRGASHLGARAHAPPVLISCGGDGMVQIFEIPETVKKVRTTTLRPQVRIRLPSYVYSVRPHPGLSTEPSQIVLACGGHEFGLVICKVVRFWATDAQHESGHWACTGTPWQQTVNYKVQPSRTGGSGGISESSGRRRLVADRHASKEKTEAQTADILCVCFSSQPTSLDNLYATDSAGRIMLFHVRYDASADAGRGGVRAALVRVYRADFLDGVPTYGIDVVTCQLLAGKRLNHVLLSTVDDWVLLYSRDHFIRLVSLQRGVARVEIEMSGAQCGTYPLRGAMSPDGEYVACGSETGELLAWSAIDGKVLQPPSVPQVQLAGPVMDVVWSMQHHLLACCALDEQAPPILVFVGGDPTRPLNQSKSKMEDTKAKSRELPLRFVPLAEAPREEYAAVPAFVPSGVAPVAAAVRQWEADWLDSTVDSKVVGYDEKRNMKEQILAKLREEQELKRNYAFANSLPGGL